MKRLITIIAAVGLTLCHAAGVRAQQTYVLTDLGAYSPDWDTGIKVNASGQGTGSLKDAAGNSRPFLWTPDQPNGATGTLKLLPLPDGATLGAAYALNASGQVAGLAQRVQNGIQEWIHAVRWEANGGAFTVISPADTRGVARSINDLGQVVGTQVEGSSPPYAFLWTNGTLTDIGCEQGQSINAGGQILGSSDSGGPTVGFVWTPSQPNGTVGTLRKLPTKNGGGAAINDLGQVVGTDSISTWGFYYDPNVGEKALPIPAGADRAIPRSINNLGQIVGRIDFDSLGARDACLWDSYTAPPRDLTKPDQVTLVNPDGTPLSPGWKLMYGSSINDIGQIGAVATNPAGQERLVLLTPKQSKIAAEAMNRPADGIYRITADPKMPTITLSARITGLTPDPTANTDFEWHYRLVYQSPTVKATGEPLDLSFPVPGDPAIDAVVHSTGDAPVTLDFQDKIRGGDLVITVKATVGGKPLQAAVTGLKIRAGDVPWAAVYSALPHATLRRIARYEAGGKQAFLADGTPIWDQNSDGSTAGGVGVMRIRDLSLSNDRIADLVWNWRANVAAGIARFNAGKAAGDRYYTLLTGQGPGPDVSQRERLAAQSRWNGYLAWINAYRRHLNQHPLAGLYLAPFTSTSNYNYVRNHPPVDELNEKELNTVRLYDGTGGYVDALGLPLLEFKVDTESLGGRMVPKVLRVVPYGTSLIGIVGYRRVAPKERPGAGGKPNDFVDRVLDSHLDYGP